MIFRKGKRGEVMELLQLKYFSHAAKTENFSHTAQKFRVPASCVSASIKKLENELGVRLFDRSANKIKLNEYGKILLKAVETSDELLKKAKADILDLSKDPPPELRLLIMSNRQNVTDAISAFKMQYPKTHFYIHHEAHFDVSNLSDYDIIVTDRNISNNSFEKRLWVHEEIFLAVHKAHPLAKKSVVSPKELRYEKFIFMPKGSSLRDHVEQFMQKYGVELEVVIESDDPRYIQQYLNMGLGITFFPAVSWKAQVNKEIKLLRIEEELYRDSYLYINRASSGMVRLFTEMLEAE
ncbi:MAG: LysR family transcriptional regulator [Ruminococcaceae bacterium]|nr:LysR family transcriptional regulator [Oscillospiraceae bacterium]